MLMAENTALQLKLCPSSRGPGRCAAPWPFLVPHSQRLVPVHPLYAAAERQMEASRAIASKRELQQRLDELKSDFDKEQETTQDITSSMTLQYKSMQEGLMNRINTLERTIMDLKDQLGAPQSRPGRGPAAFPGHRLTLRAARRRDGGRLCADGAGGNQAREGGGAGRQGRGDRGDAAEDG